MYNTQVARKNNRPGGLTMYLPTEREIEKSGSLGLCVQPPDGGEGRGGVSHVVQVLI